MIRGGKVKDVYYKEPLIVKQCDELSSGKQTGIYRFPNILFCLRSDVTGFITF